MAATDISNGSLSWDARVTTGNLVKDIKTVADLLASIGNVEIDTQSIEKALQQQAQREIELQKEVISTVQGLQEQGVSSFTKSVEQQSALAKTSIDDLRKYIESIPFTSNVDKSGKIIDPNAIISSGTVGSLDSELASLSASDISTGTKNAAKSIQQLNTTLQDAKRAYQDADQTTKQYLDDLTFLEVQAKNAQKAQSDLNKQYTAGEVSEDQYLQRTTELKASQEQITASINETKTAQKQYQESLDGTTTTTQKLMTQLRQMKNQIAENSLNGIVDQDLIDRAVALERTLSNTNSALSLASSNTAFIDAASEGVRGLIGGFTALSGVVGLFTDDSEKANKIMQDTIGFMGIINGIEQVSQALATNGKLNTYIRLLLQRNAAQQAGTVATTGETVAEEVSAAASEADAAAKTEEAVATEEATAAQSGLNAVLMANPFAFILVAVTALVGAYELLLSSIGDDIEAQTKLNNAMSEAQGIMNDIVSINAQRYKDDLNNAEQQLALAQATGKSNAAIKEQQDNVISARKALNDFNAAALLSVSDEKTYTPSWMPKDTASDIEKVTQRYAELNKQLDAAKNNLLIINQTNGDKTLKENAQSRVDLLEKQIAPLKSIVDENTKIQNDAATQQAQFQKQQNEAALSSDTSYWQAKVTLAQKGTKNWLDAQLKLNQAQYNKSVSNSNATSGDLANAQAQLTEANKEANKTYNLQRIADNQAVIEAQLDAVKQGSAEELALKLEQLEQQKQASILNANENAAQIEKINADSLKKQNDLKAQYEQADVDRVLQFQQDFAKQQLSGLSSDSDSYLAFTKQLNDVSAKQQTKTDFSKAIQQNPSLDPDIIQDALKINTDNYLDYANKLESIDFSLAQNIRSTWAETVSKNQQADNAFMQTQIENANKIIDIQTEIAKTKNNAIINNQNSSDLQKANAQLSNSSLDINATQAKLQNIADQISKNYSDEGKAISEYIKQAEVSFSDIKQLSDKESPISHVFDGIKDPAAKQAVEELLTKLRALKLAAEDLKKQKPSAIFDGVGQIAKNISSLGSAVSELNEGLGDTLQLIGALVENTAKIAAGIFSGNASDIISGSVGLVSSVVGLFSAAKKSAEEAKQQLEQYNEQLIKGQYDYNEQLIQSEKIQSDITQGKVDELNAQIALNEQQKEQYEQLLETAQLYLETSGQYISGEHTEKYGGFLGIGKKTKVVQDFSSLGITSDMTDDEIAAILKEKEALNQLTGQTKVYADAWLEAYENMEDATEQAEELKEQLAEAYTGTTADDIAQSIIDGLKEGKTAVAQFSDDINSMISNALLSGIKNTLLSNTVAKIWEQFEDDIAANTDADGNTTSLTAAQIAELQAQSQAAVQQGIDLYTAMESVFPELAESLSQANGLTGAIQQSLTEETGDELAGLWRGQYDITKQTLQVATQSLAYHQQIQQNTYDSLQLFIQYLPFLKSINSNTAPSSTARNMGL